MTSSYDNRKIYGLNHTYLFRDREVIVLDDKVSDEDYFNQVEDNSKAKLYYFDKNNHKLTNNPMEAYKEYLDKGYSIINSYGFKAKKDGNLEDDISSLEVILADKLDRESINNIYDSFDELKDVSKKTEIYNLRKTDYSDDYDWLDSSQCDFNLNNAISILMRAKTNNLNEKEQEEYNHYVNFDLEEILTKDNKEKYPDINNDNAGVVVITDDKIYSSSNHKMQHGAEMDTIIKSVHNDQDDLSMLDVAQKANKHNDIIIQLANYQDKGEVLTWLPKEISDSQKELLSSFNSQVNDIITKNPDVKIEKSASIVGDSLADETKEVDIDNYLNESVEKQL